LEPLQRLETGFALAERCIKGETPGSIRLAEAQPEEFGQSLDPCHDGSQRRTTL